MACQSTALLLLALFGACLVSVQGRKILGIEISRDPTEPIYTSSVSGGGLFYDYERETAVTLSNEENEDGSRNIGLFAGTGSALAVGLKPNATVTVDITRENDANVVFVESTADALVPVFTSTSAEVKGAELAIAEDSEDSSIGVAFSVGSAQAESTQKGDNSTSVAFFATQNQATPESALSGRIAGAFVEPVDAPEGTTSTEASAAGFAYTAEDREAFIEVLPILIAQLWSALYPDN